MQNTTCRRLERRRESLIDCPDQAAESLIKTSTLRRHAKQCSTITCYIIVVLLGLNWYYVGKSAWIYEKLGIHSYEWSPNCIIHFTSSTSQNYILRILMITSRCPTYMMWQFNILGTFGPLPMKTFPKFGVPTTFGLHLVIYQILVLYWKIWHTNDLKLAKIRAS
jgi:hypothetical protein